MAIRYAGESGDEAESVKSDWVVRFSGHLKGVTTPEKGLANGSNQLKDTAMSHEADGDRAEKARVRIMWLQ